MADAMWVTATATIPDDDTLGFAFPDVRHPDFHPEDWAEETGASDAVLAVVDLAWQAAHHREAERTVTWDPQTRTMTWAGSWGYGLLGFGDDWDIAVVDAVGGTWERADDGGKYEDGTYESSAAGQQYPSDRSGAPYLSAAAIAKLASRTDAEIVAAIRSFPT